MGETPAWRATSWIVTDLPPRRPFFCTILIRPLRRETTHFRADGKSSHRHASDHHSSDYSSSNNPGALALYDGLDFLGIDHGRVAGRRHGERAVRGAIIHRRLRPLPFEEGIRKAGGEAIAAAD